MKLIMKIKIFITHNVKYNNLFYITIMTYVKFVIIINILKI